MAKGLTSLADRRRVDEREHFFEVLGQHRIKERLVGILQSSQEDIAVEVAGELAHCLEAPRRLNFQGSDMGRQEPVEREGGPLFVGKSGPLVEHRVGEQRRPFELGLDEIGLRGRALIGHAECSFNVLNPRVPAAQSSMIRTPVAPLSRRLR